MPKCMISINGEPILARMLKQLAGLVETTVVVTGYREELVMEYCQSHFRNVVIARNPAFATTNTAQSLVLGSRFVNGKTIFLDGDLLLEQASLRNFFALAERTPGILLGVAEARTEQPVYAHCRPCAEEPDFLEVGGFSRTQNSAHEWANLFVGPSNIMDGASSYVFEKLAEVLPVRAGLIEVEEVDTPQDLVRAEAAVRLWG
jgi:CTP:molybdopterin cytidylyltransferase MocA